MLSLMEWVFIGCYSAAAVISCVIAPNVMLMNPLAWGLAILPAIMVAGRYWGG